MMKKLSKKEMQTRMLKMVCYIDNICRSNNIKYSLIGGTLIGAVREGGFLDWDDDIDIILNHDDYEKLLKILKKEKNSNYMILYPGVDESYYYPFLKLIDSNTILQEEKALDINNYGLFIDIFEYNNFPNNKVVQYLYIFKLWLIERIFYWPQFLTEKSNIKFYKIRRFIARQFELKKVLNTYIKIHRKYNNNNKCKYIYSNWPVYNYKKAIQKKSNFVEFQDIIFEGKKLMVSKTYDELLKTTFGDYMIPPTKENQIDHDLNVYLK